MPTPTPPAGGIPYPQRADVVVVHLVRLVVTLRALADLLQEPVALLERIVQLGEAVAISIPAT